jgi:D-amino-acid dehydrogenase
MKKEVIIVGSGIVGLVSAYFLNKKGHKVTILEKSSTIKNAATYGNAGAISPFEKMPLSNPPLIKNSIKLFFQGKSPFIINPTLNTHFYKWLYHFLKSANQKRIQRSLMLFKKYGQESIKIYNSLSKDIEIDYHQKGILTIFTQEDSYKAKLKSARNNEKFKIYSKEELKEVFSALNLDKIEGGILLKDNAHINPSLLLETLPKYLKDNGVEIITNCNIVDAKVSFNKILSLKSEDGKTFVGDEFLFCTGAHQNIFEKLNKKLLMVPAKGHSITFNFKNIKHKPKLPIIFNDLFLFLTPRKNNIRLTGKIEFNPSSYHQVNEKYINSILKIFKEHTSNIELIDIEKWSGVRPLPTNDMPFIGRDTQYNNLIFATGLGWLGITFGPVVSKIASTLINKEQENYQNKDVLAFSGLFQ